MSRTTTTSQTATAAAHATGGLARGLSLKTNTAKLLHTSDVKLFVTNLRLLDLDRRTDWPHITVQTFSAKNADQKQRIGAVEWALFRLFEIWDPQETGQKLQPFFPPLEPLQSRNLRIALHRSLDTLKKDGVLGRETVLRKTMLDECKGEKFYEILASFSATVLKRVLASQPDHQANAAVARTLATSTSLSHREQASLLPLAIAHRATLVNLLRKKEEKRARYIDFANLLDAKAGEINKRIRKAVETPRATKPAVPQREADVIKRQLKDNWIGDQRWVDIILHGDDAQSDAGFLNGSFKRVWRVIDQGRKLEDAVPEAGLLENLQLRVDEQKARLDKWKEFHKRMQSETAAGKTPKKSAATVKEFKFDEHLQLQLQPKTTTAEPVQPQKLRPAYREILLDMDEELSQAATARYNQSSTAPLVPGRRTSYGPVKHHASRSQSDSVSSATSNLPKISKPSIPSRIKPDNILSNRPALLPRPSAATPLDSEATLVGRTSALYTAASPSPAIDEPMDDASSESPVESPTEQQLPHFAPTEDLPDAPSAPASPTLNPPSLPSSPPQPTSSFPSEPPILEPPTLTTEESLAAQIVSTIGDATPSPVKRQPRLSLLERTRMSMVRTTSFPPISESPSLPEPPTPLDRHAALMERTRASMAAMSLGSKAKSRTSLAPGREGTEKRKVSAEQGFPVNQFDTPARTRGGRKSQFLTVDEGEGEGEGEDGEVRREAEEVEMQKTPKEDLFSDDVDYDRVFRSRPRIATSPVFGTPAVGMGVQKMQGRSVRREREEEEEFEEGGSEEGEEEEEEFEEGVTGVDLGDVDVDMDGESEEEMESPSRRAWR